MKRGTRKLGVSVTNRSVRLVAAAVIGAVLGGLAVPAPGVVGAVEGAAVLPTGFSDSVAISGLKLPTTVQFAANGEIFVAEKAGIIKRLTGLGSTPSVVADLRDDVYNFWDRGLLGLAVDPQYPTRPYIYALYSKLRPGSPSNWSRTDGNDTCPGPTSTPMGPGATTDGCVTNGILSRLTLNSAGVMTTRTVLVEDWCGQFPSHHIGTVRFGPDGYLYATSGEGASFALNDMDHGQKGGTVINPETNEPFTPRNPCGDPPGGVGGEMTMPTAQGGSLRAQDKRTTSDPTGLAGTLIRINPDTGLAVSTNASYATGRDENDRRIIAYGLRNPFRFTFRPGTSPAEVWIGDVGSYKWEELNRVPSVTGPVANFGWPCYEGSSSSSEVNTGWKNKESNICTNLYAAGLSAVKAPYFGYRQQQPVVANDTCSLFGGSAVSGLAFYGGGSYPAGYQGALFFADYSRRCIWAMRPGTNGLPDPARVITLVDGAGLGPVDLQIGPGGDLFYAELDGGAIRQITYSGGNQPPSIVATANPTSGPAPLTVQFDASGTTDPDPGDVVSFAWDLDGDGQFDDATGPKASRTYALGTHSPKIRARDDHGNTSTKTFTIVSGNSAPTVTISAPLASATWAAGQSISFAGSATDPQDGNLPSSRLSWEIILHHCRPQDCHQHLVETIAGVSSGSFEAPDHEYPSHLELRLTAQDSGGLNATASRTVQPRTVDLTYAANPSGLEIIAGSEREATPFARRVIVGSAIGLNAPSPQSQSNLTYTYASWSDGGQQSHVITAPATNTTYTARYTAPPISDAPGSCAAATNASAQGEWLRDTIGSSTDVDWYRFQVAQPSRARIVLGALPANYRLDLYSSCGTRIASSNLAKKRFEQIYRQLAAGTYRVRVKGVKGKSNATQPYGLRFQVFGNGLAVVSSSSWTDGSGTLHINGEVLNNTADKYRLVRIEAKYYDGSGNLLATEARFANVNVMTGRTRSPFGISIARPAGFARYALTVTGSKTTDIVVGKLRVTSKSSGTNSTGPWWRGKFVNDNSFQVRWTETLTTLYDRWGDVINTSRDWTNPQTIPAGGSSSYAIEFSEHYAGWNRKLIVLQTTGP